MGKKYKIRLKKPVVRYPSSLIQQNHGESIKGHGMSVWDVEKKTFEHIEIPNDYGYYTMDIDNGVVPDVPDIPIKSRLRVRVSNTDSVQLKKALTIIQTKYGIKEIAVNRTDRLTERVRGDRTVDVGDVTNPNYQYELIEDYLNRNHTVSDETLLEIKRINDDLNNQLPDEDVSRNIDWKLKKFEFSNMFSYGEDNVVDFTKLNGIIGLFAPNASGKCVEESTEIDIEFDEQYIIDKLGFLPDELKINKTVQMKDIYNIFSKYGDINIKVNTPYGYKKILDCDITAKNSKVIKTKVESGLFIETSPGHLLKTKNGRFKKVSEFQPGSYIKTKNGNEKIKSIEYLKDKKDLYDIQVEDVKQYYSNGIISHNSALLDSLSFCLFDTSARTFKADRVLNNKKNTFSCKVNFEINESEYFIERRAKRQRNGHVKVDVDFWTTDDSGDKISLNGDQRRTTNNNIYRVIGTYDDFILTALSLQTNSTVFIDKTQKERKDLLAQFMGLGAFDRLYTLANEEISDISAILKDFNKTDYDVELSDIEKDNIQYKEVHKDLRSEKKTLTNRRKELSDQVLGLTKKLRPIDASISDIDKLNTALDEFNSQLDSIDTRLGSVKSEMIVVKSKNTELTGRVKLYTDSNVNQKYNDFIELENKRKDVQIEIDKLKIEVRNKLDKIEKLGNLGWDVNGLFMQ